MALIDGGKLGLDDLVADHLPWFTPKSPDGSVAKITVRHLITHTSGLGYEYPTDPMICRGLQDTNFTLEENFTRVARQPLSFAPGTGWQYGVNIDVLGAVVAKIDGGTLGDALARYVTGPLGMVDTGFVVTDVTRLAIPYGDAQPEPLRMGDPHTVTSKYDGSQTVFSPGRAFNPRAFHSGGAGAVSTASDLLRFFEALRKGGAPILNQETVDAAMRNQIGDLPRDEKDAGQRFGFLGAVIADPAAANSPHPVGTIRWGGVYGHEWFIDRTNALTVVSMTNTPVEGCAGKFRDDVSKAVYG